MIWKDAALSFSRQTGIELSSEAFRNRYRRLEDDYIPQESEGPTKRVETQTYNQDGSVEVCKEFYFDSSEEKTPDDILLLFTFFK